MFDYEKLCYCFGSFHLKFSRFRASLNINPSVVHSVITQAQFLKHFPKLALFRTFFLGGVFLGLCDSFAISLSKKITEPFLLHKRTHLWLWIISSSFQYSVKNKFYGNSLYYNMYSNIYWRLIQICIHTIRNKFQCINAYQVKLDICLF